MANNKKRYRERQLPIQIIKSFNVFNKFFVRKDENKMIDMETSKPLDKALNFNTGNIFEYIDLILSDVNADIIGEQADRTVGNLCNYIKSLHISDADSVSFEVESIANEALSQTSNYAYKAGFMEACRLIRTLQSF